MTGILSQSSPLQSRTRPESSEGFFYSREPYGEGLFSTVIDRSVSAEQSFRVIGYGVRYMSGNGNYDPDEPRPNIRPRRANSRVAGRLDLRYFIQHRP